MYDIHDFRPESKEVAVAILVAVVFMVVVFGAGYLCGITHTRAGTEGLHDNGDPAQNVRTEIDVAGSGVSTAKSRIDNAATAAGRVEERLSDAQERARYVQGTADEGRRIIEECQSVLREVRAGGKKDPAKN